MDNTAEGAEVERIRIVVVDDHPLVRSGLEAMMLMFADLDLVGSADSGTEAVNVCERLQPDVVLMDLVMPGMNGVAATTEICRRCPSTRVLALTSFEDEELMSAALRAGAIGYLLKNILAADLATAIREAHAGRSVMAPEVIQALVRSVSGPPKVGHNLTAREREILALVTEGFTNSEIAARLVLSRSTVKTHVSHVIRKLDASTRTEAATVAVRLHLV